MVQPWDSKPQPPAPKAATLPIELSRRLAMNAYGFFFESVYISFLANGDKKSLLIAFEDSMDSTLLL